MAKIDLVKSLSVGDRTRSLREVLSHLLDVLPRGTDVYFPMGCEVTLTLAIKPCVVDGEKKPHVPLAEDRREANPKK